jgi:hypothetical protein
MTTPATAPNIRAMASIPERKRASIDFSFVFEKREGLRTDGRGAGV